MNIPAKNQIDAADSLVGSQNSTGASLEDAADTIVNAAPNSRFPLIVVGLLWILLAASIVIFEYARPAQIEIEWTTETEFETAGFNIYRASSPDGDFEKLNPSLIPSEGEASTGATYTFVDREVIPGDVYYYLLEDIEYSNNVVLHEDEMLSGRFVRFEWWALVSVPVSLIVGLVIIATGFRQEN